VWLSDPSFGNYFLSVVCCGVLEAAAMERINAAQRAQVAKMSCSRPAVKLSQAGVREKAIDAMSSEQLMDAWAELVATGKDVATAPAAAASSGAMDFEREKLAFEERRFAAELEQRRADAAAAVAAAEAIERREAAAAAAAVADRDERRAAVVAAAEASERREVADRDERRCSNGGRRSERTPRGHRSRSS